MRAFVAVLLFAIVALVCASEEYYHPKPKPKYTCEQVKAYAASYKTEWIRLGKLAYETKCKLDVIKMLCKKGFQKKCDLIYPYEQWVEQYTKDAKYYQQQYFYWFALEKKLC